MKSTSRLCEMLGFPVDMDFNTAARSVSEGQYDNWITFIFIELRNKNVSWLLIEKVQRHLVYEHSESRVCD